MTPKTRKVSLIEFVILVSLVIIDVGLLVHTIFRVWSHQGSADGKPLIFLFANMIFGGLMMLLGINSLNATLRSSRPEDDQITIESLDISPTYTVMMLVYGCFLLLVMVAAGLVIINLSLGR